MTSKISHSLRDKLDQIPKSLINGFHDVTGADVPPKLVVCAPLPKVAKAIDQIHRNHPVCEIAAICLPLKQLNSLGEDRKIHFGDRTLPAIEMNDLAHFHNCSPVIFWDSCVAPDLLYFPQISRSGKATIFPELRPGMTGCKYASDFYSNNAARLEKIYAELADAESRDQFAGVVKALVTGSIEWLAQSPYDEYRHPAALPEMGDIIIDAGLFDSVVLRRFAMAAPQGHVYGFEPEPNNFRFVQETLDRYGDPGNITLIKKGLFSHKGDMFISDEGSSGSLSTESDRGSTCDVTDLDSFVEDSGIARVDIIKMDIEGAELPALFGARKTIAKFTPKLHVCAYHHIDDLLTIPEFLAEAAPGKYELYFAAHAPYMNEYVYYAVPKEKSS